MFDATISAKRKNKQKTIRMADLFAGAGGTSTGAAQAVADMGYEMDLLAINHWDIAIATHTKNHVAARHLCQSINALNPTDLVPGRRLHLLVASPECTHHSIARGGKPRNDQKRADAWLLMRWIEELYVENLLIENVKEFINWGPLNAQGLPDKRYRGKYFHQFVDALKINYTVDWKVLNCADYGDATSRQRFFLIAKRGKNKLIVFPEKTHASRKELEAQDNQPSLFGNGKKLKTWRSAREIIDWDLKGASVFGRKKPLSPNTMRRIYAGLFKYSLKPFVVSAGEVEPFLVNLKATDRRMRDINEPTFTQCGGNHQMLVEPFLFNLAHSGGDDKQNESRCYQLERPLPTIAGKGTFGLIEPYLVKYFNGSNAVSIDEPLSTITANYEHLGLCEPFLISVRGGETDAHSRSRSVDEPVPTITAGVTTVGVAEPFIVAYHNGKNAENRTHSVNEPLPTQDTSNRYAVAEPFLVCFRNNQGAQSLDDPLKTLTAKDSYGLAIPELGAILDIRFRMLQPHELSAAMGFPKSYEFTGTRDQKVKQIGNAVPCNTAKALVKAILNAV